MLSSQGDAGQFRTPRHIIDFMVELVEVVDPQKSETVLDSACGTAGLLFDTNNVWTGYMVPSGHDPLLLFDESGEWTGILV